METIQTPRTDALCKKMRYDFSFCPPEMVLRQLDEDMCRLEEHARQLERELSLRSATQTMPEESETDELIDEMTRIYPALCDPECEGRCRTCPAELMNKAAKELKKLRALTKIEQQSGYTEGMEAAAKICEGFGGIPELACARAIRDAAIDAATSSPANP